MTLLIHPRYTDIVKDLIAYENDELDDITQVYYSYIPESVEILCLLCTIAFSGISCRLILGCYF